MGITEFRQLALFVLSNYERAWSENAALGVILDTYPMPDGTKGIPRWREFRDEWMKDSEAKSRVAATFAQIREQIQSTLVESEVLELLQRFPPTGGAN